MQNDPFHLALIRDSLGQSGSEQGAMLAGGLRLGAVDVPATPGDIYMEGSVRKSTALGVALTSSVEPSIPNNAWTAVPMDTIRWDTDSLADLVANPARLTVHTPGVFAIFARVSFYANGTGLRMLGVQLNASYFVTIGQAPTNPANTTPVFAAGIFACDSGDTLDVVAYQTSGGPLNLLVAATSAPEFAIVRIA